MRASDPREKARAGTNACMRQKGGERMNPQFREQKQKFRAIGLNATDRETATLSLVWAST